jgi:hypothetical protein
MFAKSRALVEWAGEKGQVSFPQCLRGRSTYRGAWEREWGSGEV